MTDGAELSADLLGATVCAHLMVGSVSTVIISRSTALPVIVIEEAIRNEKSSCLLRARLWAWLQTAPDMALLVPHDILAALGRRVEEDGAAARKSFGAFMAFSVFDSTARERFLSLEATAGQSMMSVFNNPLNCEPSSIWSWFSSAASTEDTSAKTASPAVGAEATESSSQLLQLHADEFDVSSYVSLVSPSFNANRLLGRKDGAEEELPISNTLPDVPLEWFSPMEVASVISRLPSNEEKAARSALPLQGAGAASPGASPSQPPPPNLPGPVTLASFKSDYDAIEVVLNDLRKWESTVESCLMEHVQMRSHDFFTASMRFADLHEETSELVEDVKTLVNRSLLGGRDFVDGFLHVGLLYRRHLNVNQLSAVLKDTVTVAKSLERVDNWVLLPERESHEMPQMVELLLSLERQLSRPLELAGADTANLCLAASWPSRVKTARLHMASILSNKLQEQMRDSNSAAEVDPVWTREALRLGCWETCAAAHHHQVVAGAWVEAKSGFVSLMLNCGHLSDAEGNRLLQLTMDGDEHPEKRAEAFSTISMTSVNMFYGIYKEMVRSLSQYFSDKTGAWLSYLSHGFLPLGRQGPTSGDAEQDNTFSVVVRRVTNRFLEDLIREVESILATLLGSTQPSGGNGPSTSIMELLNQGDGIRIARATFEAFPAFYQAIQSASDLLWAGEEEDRGSAEEASSTAACRRSVGRTVRPALSQLITAEFRSYHHKALSNVKLMLSSELWDIAASIDHRFQSHVDRLCSSDERAVSDFRFQSVMEPAGSRRAAPKDDLLLNTTAQRVYLPAVDLQSQGDGGGPSDAINGSHQEGYVAPNVILVLIDFLSVYDNYLASFPFLAPVFVKSVVEFLGMFVATAADLVLGEKAIQNKVLEGFTALHYTVTSQTFSFLSAFLPRFQTRLMNCFVPTPTSPLAQGGEAEAASTAREKNIVQRFLVDQLNDVIANCTSHRKECLTRISRGVLRSVSSGKFLIRPAAPATGTTATVTTTGTAVAAKKGKTTAAGTVVNSTPIFTWGSKGHEWVLRMLTEVAKLLRNIRPLLPSRDVDAVVVPIVGSFAIRLQEMTKVAPVKLSEEVKQDVLLYKANTEKFGYDVLAATKLLTVESVVSLEGSAEGVPLPSLQPHSTEEETQSFFFPPESPLRRQSPVTAAAPAAPSGAAAAPNT